jgi:DNA-binding LacI/PurR family transcriptional regulator
VPNNTHTAWDDCPVARRDALDITTVRQDVELLGRTAVHRCITRLTTDTDSSEIVVPAVLMTRSSTGRRRPARKSATS